MSKGLSDAIDQSDVDDMHRASVRRAAKKEDQEKIIGLMKEMVAQWGIGAVTDCFAQLYFDKPEGKKT